MSARLPRETVETLVMEAEKEMIDAIIHNEQTRYQQFKETREWLLTSLPTPSKTTRPSPATSRTSRSSNESTGA